MNSIQTKLIYFSATGTTKKVVKHLANAIEKSDATNYNILKGQPEEIHFASDELAIFGIPVYSGRIPAVAIEALNRFKGNNTPAILVAVYGNRAYEDALLELKNLVESNLFIVLSAAAFIAEHAIFPSVATGRPDEKDLALVRQFAIQSRTLYLKHIESATPLPEITVDGSFPYRSVKSIPLKPKGNRRCNKCGICVKACPTQAIHADHPRRTDRSRCISCGHCIHICPQKSRHFGGILYLIVRNKFTASFGATRNEPRLFPL